VPYKSAEIKLAGGKYLIKTKETKVHAVSSQIKENDNKEKREPGQRQKIGRKENQYNV
jgi:hypothetical protein